MFRKLSKKDMEAAIPRIHFKDFKHNKKEFTEEKLIDEINRILEFDFNRKLDEQEIEKYIIIDKYKSLGI
jgi:hypothetical protein